MTTPREVPITAILDAETGALLSLKNSAVPGAAGAINVAGISAINTVAGVSPVAKDIPVATLRQALAAILSLDTLTPDAAGNITLANLRQALLSPFTVAGVAASGGVGAQHWGGDIDSTALINAIQAALVQAQVAARTMTWAQHITAGAGTYDGQTRRISVTAGGPNQVFTLEWVAAANAWFPLHGRQLIHASAVVTDNTATTQTVTATPMTAPAAMFRPPAGGFPAVGMEVDYIAEDSASATARTWNTLLDGTVAVAGPLAAAANRRVSGRCGFIPTDATHGFGITKADSSEYDWAQGANSNLLACDRTWANAIAVSSVATFTAAGTATLRRCKYYLVTG